MLLRLEEHITNCRIRAAEFEKMAREASSGKAAVQYLQLAKSWRHLEKNYEFVVALERFLQSTFPGQWPPRGEGLPKRPDLGLFQESGDTVTAPGLASADPNMWRDLLVRLVNLKWGSPSN